MLGDDLLVGVDEPAPSRVRQALADPRLARAAGRADEDDGHVRSYGAGSTRGGAGSPGIAAR